MTIIEMMEQTGFLALLGIGIVFSFLLILVISITLMSKILNARVFSRNREVSPSQSDKAAGSKTGDPRITAAISAAVAEHQKS